MLFQTGVGNNLIIIMPSWIQNLGSVGQEKKSIGYCVSKTVYMHCKIYRLDTLCANINKAGLWSTALRV